MEFEEAKLGLLCAFSSEQYSSKKAGIQHTTQPRMMKKAFYIFIYIVVVCNRTYIHTAPELLLLVLLCIIRFCSSMPTLLYTSTGIQQCYRSMLWYTRPIQSSASLHPQLLTTTRLSYIAVPHTQAICLALLCSYTTALTQTEGRTLKIRENTQVFFLSFFFSSFEMK